jgi:transcriptional regulator GlxA family with amidase domain
MENLTMNPKPDSIDKTRLVVLIGFDGVAALDITGPHEVFALAAKLSQSNAKAPYRLMLLAEKAGPFRTVSGLNLVAEASWRNFSETSDTLLVAGGPDMTPLTKNTEFLAWLRIKASHTRRIGSVCTGAFALAKAGLLDNHRATTHWQAAEQLRQTYPAVTVVPDAIYLKDGNICTSAGVTAGMDLALALVEEDLGRETALAVARMLVLFLKRPGGQSQFSTLLQAQGTEGMRLTSFLVWLAEHYRESLTIEDMASKAAMSPRNFARVFSAETGVTPAVFLERIRTEHAIRLLEASTTSLDTIARESGFSGAEQLRRSFLRHLGITPREHQQRFRTTEANTKGDHLKCRTK